MLIFDIDGVLLDWTTGFNQWMIDRGEPPQGAQSAYNMNTCWPQYDDVQITAIIREFNQSPQFSALDEVPGAFTAYLRITGTFPDVKTVAVSACGLHPITQIQRLHQLYRIGYRFEEFYALDLNAGKLDTFVKFPSGGIVFEDSARHAVHASHAGHKPILLNRPYNQGTWPDVIRADNWDHVLQLLKEPA